MSFIPQTCWRHQQRSGRSKSDPEVPFWPISILTSGLSQPRGLGARFTNSQVELSFFTCKIYVKLKPCSLGWILAPAPTRPSYSSPTSLCCILEPRLSRAGRAWGVQPTTRWGTAHRSWMDSALQPMFGNSDCALLKGTTSMGHCPHGRRTLIYVGEYWWYRNSGSPDR